MTNFEEACKMSAEKWADLCPPRLKCIILAKSILMP